MKKEFYKGYKITKNNNYLKSCYNSNYIITINQDIFDYSNTIKEAREKIDKYITRLYNISKLYDIDRKTAEKNFYFIQDIKYLKKYGCGKFDINEWQDLKEN